jgi:hypothetical protein
MHSKLLLYVPVLNINRGTRSDGGWLLSMSTASIPVVGFNAVLMSEHFGAFFAFGILHAALAIRYIKVPIPNSDPRYTSISTMMCGTCMMRPCRLAMVQIGDLDLQDILPVKAYNAAKTLVLTSGVVLMSGILLLVLFYVMSSPTFGWTGEPQTHGCPQRSTWHFFCSMRDAHQLLEVHVSCRSQSQPPGSNICLQVHSHHCISQRAPAPSMAVILHGPASCKHTDACWPHCPFLASDSGIPFPHPVRLYCSLLLGGHGEPFFQHTERRDMQTSLILATSQDLLLLYSC